MSRAQPLSLAEQELLDRYRVDPAVRAFVDRLSDLTDRQIECVTKSDAVSADLARELGWPPIKTYIIDAVGTELVKIGKSYDVETRMRAMQGGSPARLSILRIIPFNCERAMHQRYAQLRQHGEWFLFDVDMLTDVFHGDLLAEAKAVIAEAA